MKRALLIWELGDGLGHVTRLIKIAERLTAKEFRCLFVVRNIELAGKYVRDRGFEVIQSPIATIDPIQGPDGSQPTTMTDILGSIGFAKLERLDVLVSAWDTLFDVIAPDIVVSDYAPTANLALFGGAIPHLVIGDGFTLQPPEMLRFPPFRKARPAFDDAEILKVTSHVQDRRGRQQLERLPQLYAGSAHEVITLPELDPFRDQRAHLGIGPVSGIPDPVDSQPVQDYFAYLSASYRFTGKILEGLIASGRQGSVYLRDSSSVARDRLRALGLNIHEEAQDMSDMARKSAVIIHHGGVGTAETVLALGRPQMLVPRHAEQWLNASSLGRLGVAIAVRASDALTVTQVSDALTSAMMRPKFADVSKTLAVALAQRPKVALDHVVSVCERLARDTRARRSPIDMLN
jgi:UDP-N-acetylglucosamine transferase subunit ALG13